MQVAIIAIGIVLIALGGLVAFKQRAPRGNADAPPAYYGRMIVGVMLGAFGLIITVFTIAYAMQR